ncbi:DsbA family protein [Puniceibacterium confluentis]|uniref:DsbA family protein n=3 Tax=Puniceibacterium confluentis TaxID=1958944 RepID=UPI0011B65D37|nr:DsbA family protein [Puniceibacterium confluentis]
MKKTLTAAAALAIGLAAPVWAFDVSAMSDAEREAFRAEVRAYLLDNPEVIFEAVEVAEQRQAAEIAAGDDQLLAANAKAIFDDGISWVGGNPDGDITVVEFMDYRCGYCRKAHDEVAELIESDGNIRFVVKEFPILGEASTLSTRFALAARLVAGDDAYKSAYDALITMTSDMSEPVLRRLAETLGLDADAVLARMDDPAIDRQINETRALAQTLKINGTPTFVMGNELVRGYVPLDSMVQIVAQERAEG